MKLVFHPALTDSLQFALFNWKRGRIECESLAGRRVHDLSSVRRGRNRTVQPSAAVEDQRRILPLVFPGITVFFLPCATRNGTAVANTQCDEAGGPKIHPPFLTAPDL